MDEEAVATSGRKVVCSQRGMVTLSLSGARIEVDLPRTRDLYDRIWWGCQCDYCTNIDLTQRRFSHPQQVEILRSFGVDPWNPIHSESHSCKPRQSPHHTRRIGNWIVYGRILGQDRTPELCFDKWNCIWADRTSPEVREGLRLTWGLEFSSSEVFHLFATSSLPNFYGEVCSFRRDYANQGCPDCRSRWRITGYLKRRSLIPTWYGLPDLRDVLKKREERVYVEFCAGCGRLEHRIVEDKPPFRIRNIAYHEELKMRKAARKAYHYYFLAEDQTETVLPDNPS